jgi:hypothetical protein
MKKIVGLAMLLIGCAGFALAGNPTPEIDASSGVAAVTLLFGRATCSAEPPQAAVASC